MIKTSILVIIQVFSFCEIGANYARSVRESVIIGDYKYYAASRFTYSDDEDENMVEIAKASTKSPDEFASEVLSECRKQHNIEVN